MTQQSLDDLIAMLKFVQILRTYLHEKVGQQLDEEGEGSTTWAKTVKETYEKLMDDLNRLYSQQEVGYALEVIKKQFEP